uniref:MADS-box protein n=1 Tax=Geum rupestre TaxID=148910 RepID=Q2XUP4_9ROSA|nr:MADS-box protein [Geum rupestre]
MGRGKIEIKRIENSSNRQVTYTKRRNGIIKKAKEITVLCDAKVFVIIVPSSGKMVDFRSGPKETLLKLLDKYHAQGGNKLWDQKHENLFIEIDKVRKENDGMQIELRHMKGEDISSLSHLDLMSLEEALEIGLSSIRDKKAQHLDAVIDNTRAVEDENKRLRYELHKRGKTEENMMEMEMEDGYHQKMQGNYNVVFRVQPNQPNLHDRM